MREISLTQGKVALVDDEDYEKLNYFSWSLISSPGKLYARRVIKVNNEQKAILMHREIMNAPKHMQVDHVNNDGLDNRKENLRLATNQQNKFNQKAAHKNNKLGIKGVRWHEKAKKFQARIQVDKKIMHLGLFDILADADQSYRIAENKYFGEFARENYKIKWQGDTWNVKYYGTGYNRYALERVGISVCWLQNKEQYFGSMEEFIKFLREREKEKT